jgi:hypothetical protein
LPSKAAVRLKSVKGSAKYPKRSSLVSFPALCDGIAIPIIYPILNQVKAVFLDGS